MTYCPRIFNRKDRLLEIERQHFILLMLSVLAIGFFCYDITEGVVLTIFILVIYTLVAYSILRKVEADKPDGRLFHIFLVWGLNKVRGFPNGHFGAFKKDAFTLLTISSPKNKKDYIMCRQRNVDKVKKWNFDV